MSRSWIVESEIHRSVRGENGEGEDEVIVGANDAELVHRCIVRCDMRLDDFVRFFSQIVECIGVKIVIGPACNNETDVLGGVFVIFIAFLVFLVPADGINFRRIVRECLLPTSLCNIEAGLFRANVFGVRVCKFVCADELFTDGDGLANAIGWLTGDGIWFTNPVGKRSFGTGLCVTAFAVADHKNSLFVAAYALEHVADVS